MSSKIFIILTIIFFLSCAPDVNKSQSPDIPSSQKEDTVSQEWMPETENSAAYMAEEIAKHIYKLPNNRITVADFTDIEGNGLEEGKLFAEQVIARILGHGGIRVIERSQLNRVLEEKKLSLVGITQDEEKEIGTILNIDAIISGTIVHFDEYEEIHARMVDVTTGEIYCAVEHRKRLQQRQKEFAALPPEERRKIEKEFQTRETERQKDPELYRLIRDHQALLQRLKRNDPSAFDRVVRTIRRLKQLKADNPRTYLLITEPPNSHVLIKLERRKPEEFRKVVELRNELRFVFKISPTFNELLLKQRERMISKRKR